jgi:uncharacterized protein YndB with AHSA1/START domain
MSESYNFEEMTRMTGHVATAAVHVDASPERVWAALTEPEQIAVYMHGSQVRTSWEVGAPITWEGEYDGRPYQDKGEVLVVDRPRTLSVTHYSPLMGQPDEPDSYHTLVYTLTEDDGGIRLELSQDGNESAEQAEQFSRNWQQMLDGLKALVEGQSPSPSSPGIS